MTAIRVRSAAKNAGLAVVLCSPCRTFRLRLFASLLTRDQKTKVWSGKNEDSPEVSASHRADARLLPRIVRKSNSKMTLVQDASCDRNPSMSSKESHCAVLEPQAWSIGGQIAAALVSFGFATLSLAANATD